MLSSWQVHHYEKSYKKCFAIIFVPGWNTRNSQHIRFDWCLSNNWKPKSESLVQTHTFVRSVDSPANVNSKWNLYVGFNCVYTYHAERWSCAHRRRQKNTVFGERTNKRSNAVVWFLPFDQKNRKCNHKTHNIVRQWFQWVEEKLRSLASQCYVYLMCMSVCCPIHIGQVLNFDVFFSNSRNRVLNKCTKKKSRSFACSFAYIWRRHNNHKIESRTRFSSPCQIVLRRLLRTECVLRLRSHKIAYQRLKKMRYNFIGKRIALDDNK